LVFLKSHPPFHRCAAPSLTSTLLFWLDTRKIARNQLASDLRYMIDKALAEAGITIAFPQRDIHFDRDVPLRVEIARQPAAPASSPERKAHQSGDAGTTPQARS
jgi:potassium-dependent mechanosensitive channel